MANASILPARATRYVAIFNAAVLILALSAVSCTNKASERPSASQDAPLPPLKVVASFYPLKWAVERAGATASVLTQPGVEAHDLELRPSDINEISTADLVVFVGDGFQPAVEKAAAERPSLNVLGVVELIPKSAGDDHAQDDHGHSDEKSESQGNAAESSQDPHVWLDPLRMAEIVRAIGARLGEIRPEGRDHFDRAVLAAVADLQALDREFSSRLGECKSRTIITSHAAFAYLASRYALVQVSLFGISPSDEPTPRRLRKIREAARESGATTIFIESPASRQPIETLAAELDLKVAMLNPIEGLTAEESARGEDYMSLMRANLNALVSALECQPRP